MRLIGTSTLCAWFIHPETGTRIRHLYGVGYQVVIDNKIVSRHETMDEAMSTFVG